MFTRCKPIVTSIFMLLIVVSCTTSTKIKSGVEAYSAKKYALAVPLLESEFNSAKDNASKAKIALLLADSYDNQNLFDKAEQWYLQYRDLSTEPDAVITYARALMRSEKYAEARDVLKEHLKINRQDKFRYGVLLSTCEEVIALGNKADTATKVTTLPFNSPQLDFGVVITADSLYFSSTRPRNGDYFTDEWMNQAYTSVFSVPLNEAKNISAANPTAFASNDFHSTAPVFTADGKTAYFTMCGSLGITTDYCQIYRIKKDVGIWSAPEQVKLFADTVNNGHPFITADGNLLYFSSDVALGYGGKDMYVSTIAKDGTPGEPVNLGSKVNTAFNELYPSVNKSGTALYYSSDNLLGFGGLDIFSAEKSGRQFINPKRMPYGINSGADDFGLVVLAGNPNDTSTIWSGYFTSNRKGGAGNDDIYFGTLKKTPPKPLLPPLLVLNGNVIEPTFEDVNNPNSKKTGQIPVSRPTVNLNGGRLDSDNQGLFSTELDSNTNYVLKVSKEGYLSAEINFTTKGIQAKPGDTLYFAQTVILNKIYKNVEIVLQNIYYDYDKWDIREDARPTLDSLAMLLQQNPKINIELASHTDCRGNDVYNQTLSQKRAESAVNYLIEKGINPTRLTAKGYGESIPVDTCVCESCSEEQHQRNRRTSFKILE